jgi:hypothetical protein
MITAELEKYAQDNPKCWGCGNGDIVLLRIVDQKSGAGINDNGQRADGKPVHSSSLKLMCRNCRCLRQSGEKVPRERDIEAPERSMTTEAVTAGEEVNRDSKKEYHPEHGYVLDTDNKTNQSRLLMCKETLHRISAIVEAICHARMTVKNANTIYKAKVTVFVAADSPLWLMYKNLLSDNTLVDSPAKILIMRLCHILSDIELERSDTTGGFKGTSFIGLLGVTLY